MTELRQQIVAAARECLDTPFQHQGRIKGLFMDCAGLIIYPAHCCGLSDFDIIDYSPVPDGTTMGRILDEHLERIPFSEKRLADVFWMAFEKQPQHLAIITQLEPLYIIHADTYASGGGRVVEHRLDSVWQKRIRGVYRYPGVD